MKLCGLYVHWAQDIYLFMYSRRNSQVLEVRLHNIWDVFSLKQDSLPYTHSAAEAFTLANIDDQPLKVLAINCSDWFCADSVHYMENMCITFGKVTHILHVNFQKEEVNVEFLHFFLFQRYKTKSLPKGDLKVLRYSNKKITFSP